MGTVVYKHPGIPSEKTESGNALQISLLNNDCEKILKELEKMKKEK